MKFYLLIKFKESRLILIEIPTVKVHAERKTGFLNFNIFTSSFWNCWKKWTIYLNQIFAQRTLNHCDKQNGCIFHFIKRKFKLQFYLSIFLDTSLITELILVLLVSVPIVDPKLTISHNLFQQKLALFKKNYFRNFELTPGWHKLNKC
jgi:hypothetical protein